MKKWQLYYISYMKKETVFAKYFAQDNKDVFSLFPAVIQRQKCTVGALEMGVSRIKRLRCVPHRCPLCSRGKEHICMDI